MILSSYYQLAKAIREALPGLVWIDLDKGQFADKGNVPALPAVLIDFSPIDWQTFGQGVQLGSGTVTLKLGVRLPAQTHASDPFAQSNLEPLSLATALNAAAAQPDFMRSRTGSHDYPVAHFHVIEQTYEVCLTPDPPAFDLALVRLHITPQLTKPTLLP